jgi:hypothetical protein
MPNRIIRDGILTSEKVDLLSEAEELFLRRLMSVADDYGKFAANPKLLLSACYPLRTATKSLEEISLYLKACEHAGLLTIYKVKGAAFLQLTDFRQRLRIMHSKWPGENGQITERCLTDVRHMSDNGLTDDGVLEENRREEKSLPRARAHARDAVKTNGAHRASKQAKHLFQISEASMEELQAEHPRLDVRALYTVAARKCAKRHPKGGPMKLPFFREFLDREEQNLDPPGLIEARKHKVDLLVEAARDRTQSDQPLGPEEEEAMRKRIAEELRQFRKQEI